MSVAALFPPSRERERWDDFLTRELAVAEERVSAGGVMPVLDLDAIKAELSAFDFEIPRPFEDLLAWTVAQLEHGVVHITHPRYFGLFNPAPTFPAQCADRIAAAFNAQLASATTSPVAVEIEAHVIRAVAGRAGLPPECAGHFTSGGSEANATALLCALTRADSAFRTKGSRAFIGPPTFYISGDSHLAWLKIAHGAGIGRDAARLVATDGAGRMDPNALARAIAADRAQGCVPVLVGATAGTTNAGMIDPLADCAAIARDCDLWYHVDAAWGGALVASPRLRPLLAGLDQADSITIDAHKWFATTMGCGMFITRHAPMLSSVFGVTASYMPSNVPSIDDPYATSMQWSRRFLGLRLFLSLAAVGWDGYAKHVERAVEFVAFLRSELAARGWTTRNDSSLAVACIEPPPGSADIGAIVARVLASGGAWISAATFEGRQVIRACVTHGRTTHADMRALIDALQAAR